MNFKEEYKSDFDNIKVDDAFKAELAKKLNSEPSGSKRKNVYVYASVIAAAAILAIVVGVGLFGNTGPKEKNPSGEKSTLGVQAEVTTPAGPTQSLDIEKWYGDAKSAEEIYNAFATLMTGGTLETLYCSEAEIFTSKDVLEEGKVTELAQKVSKGSPVEGPLSGNVLNYMAVFEDGKIIKFQISDEGYVKLKDIEALYKYE